MKLIIDQDWLEQLKIEDIERLTFHFKELIDSREIKIPIKHPLDLSNERKAIEMKHYFYSTLKNNGDRQAKVNELNSLFSIKSLPANSFNWIDVKNPRQCYFIWSLLRLLSPAPNKALRTRARNLIISTSHSPQSHLYDFPDREYERFNLPSKPSDANGCKKNIISFMSLWDKSNEFKSEWLDILKGRWKKANDFNHKIFKHLDEKNQEHAKWFWFYLTDTIGVPSWYLVPITDSEYFACARAIFDTWEESPEGKILVLNKAYNAFHSKKFKQKPGTEKGANIWLGADEMNQLKEIAGKKGIPTKLMLKRLINSEFIKSSN